LINLFNRNGDKNLVFLARLLLSPKRRLERQVSEGCDDSHSYLIIDVPNGSFSSLILNPHATLDGTVDFTATINTGVEVFNNIAVDGNGQDFFTFTTLDGQRFLSIAFQADGCSTCEVHVVEVC
jgi:hypothetical protein